MIRPLLILFFFWATICQISAADTTKWKFNFEYFNYMIPHDHNISGGIISADHGDLRLEARYNYEAIDTGSVFAGKRISFGETVEFNLVPMAGALFGETEGVAPGLILNITWGILDFYSESEYVFDFSGTQNDFFYTWTELNLYPTKWLHFGGVLQKFEVFQSPYEFQKGVDLGITFKPFSLTGYIFNIGSKSQYEILSFNLIF